MTSTSLSKNFTLDEFLVSQTATRMGREIIPDKHETKALLTLALQTLQPIRELLESPIIITSGLRPKWLNTAIGGSKTSQHMKGEAADFVVVGITPKVVCERIVESDIPFDQLILEFNRWIHISFSSTTKLRHQVLTAYSSDGTTLYQEGIPGNA